MASDKILIGLALVLGLAACGEAASPTTSAAEATDVPEAADVPEVTQAPQATVEEPATAIPTNSAPSFNDQACTLLDPGDIEAAGLDEFPVGEPREGNDVPLGSFEANSCQWEFGNPNAQFHERLYLYVFKLGAGENPEAAYDELARRMFNGTDPSTSIGDRAIYDERTRALLVLDGGFLFYINADKLRSEPETQEKVIGLAKLVLDRK